MNLDFEPLIEQATLVRHLYSFWQVYIVRKYRGGQIADISNDGERVLMNDEAEYAVDDLNDGAKRTDLK